MKKSIFGAIILSVAIMLILTGCNKEPPKIIYSFDEVLDEIESLDLKYNTSFYDETFKVGLNLNDVESFAVDLSQLREKYSAGKSNSDKEFEAIMSFIDFRIVLVESRLSYLSYVEIIREKSPDCSDPELMYETVGFFDIAIEKTVLAGRYYDKTLNTFPASRTRLKTNEERPESLGMPLWQYRQEADEYKAIIDIYCPKHGQPLEINLDTGELV